MHIVNYILLKTYIQLLAALSPKSVFTKVSSKFDETLPVRSHFYSDHRVNCSTPTSCQSATFGPLAFCVFPVLLRQQIINKTTNAA